MKVIGNILLCFYLSISLFNAFAQKKSDMSVYGKDIYESRQCRTSFNTIPLRIVGSLEETVSNYLMYNIDFLKGDNISLQFIGQIESPGGIHLIFRQVYQEVPIYGAKIKVNLDKSSNIKSILDNIVNVKEWKISQETYKTSKILAEQNIKNFVLHNFHDANYEYEKVIFFDYDTVMPYVAYRIELYEPNGRNSYEIIVDDNMNILQEKDLNVYFIPQDSIVDAMVFLPDPLTTANTVYSPPYVDSNDIDVAALNAQRVSVTMIVTFNNDTFYLETPYVIINDFEAPTMAPVISTTDSFHFTRSQSGFEDVNVYYHIYTFKNYMESIGFPSLATFQVNVDPHGQNGADNSLFSPTDPPRLSFGEGGVDDAEDADVIIHEYGHAISHSASPWTNNGFERRALDEALGDYLAASYSRSINPFNWGDVFLWDGHNEFWPGRSAVSSKHYPENIGGNYHLNGEIWSSVLMEIWTSLGRVTTDQLVLQSIYGWMSNMTMKDAAVLLLQADTLLFGGANFNVLCDRLYARGFFTSNICIDTFAKKPSDTSVTQAPYLPNTFTPNGDGINDILYVRTSEENTAINLIIFNRWGQIVFKTQDIKVGWSGSYNGKILDSGVFTYYLEWTVGQTVNSKKGNITLLR